MIKKRLLGIMEGSLKYLAWNVVWQWLGLVASIICMMTAGRLLEAGLSQTPRADGISFSACGAVILLSILVRAYCTKKAAGVSCMAGSGVKKELRKRLYEKLTSMGSSYHEKVSTASAVQMAVEGVEQLETYFGRYLPQLCYSLLAPVTLFAVLSLISVQASLVLLVCVPLIPLTIMAVQKIAGRLMNRYWGAYTGLGDSFLENLQGLTTLKIYQADGKKAEEMDKEAEHFRKITMKVLMMQLNSIIVMDCVAYGGAAVGMIVTLLEYRAGNVTLGGAFTIILLSAEFFIPMRLLGSYFHVAMNGMAASDKLFAILDLEEEQKRTAVLPEGMLDIAMEQVEFAYEQERPILRKVFLKLPEKGMVSLVGQSGCGKSTIAALLTGKNKGYKGSIRIGGIELSALLETSLMSHVTLVSHNSYIFKGTVEDNLRMAAPNAEADQLERVLREVNLYDFLNQHEGLGTKLEERGSNLSGGQCQRLALARALLHNTPVYIFDEATSNIDAESENQIMEVAGRLAKRCCVLLISHRLANVVDSQQIYVLEDGRICEAGTHNELLAHKGTYEALYRGQKELEDYSKSMAAGKKGQKGEKCYA